MPRAFTLISSDWHTGHLSGMVFTPGIGNGGISPAHLLHTHKMRRIADILPRQGRIPPGFRANQDKCRISYIFAEDNEPESGTLRTGILPGSRPAAGCNPG